LVTGASGFIGKYLLEDLKNSGAEIMRLTRENGDIREASTFENFRHKGIKHVYHLAGLSFVPDSWEQPETYIDVNLNGMRRVLEFARAECASVTFVSSYLYAPKVPLPTPETADLAPQNPYALSKYLCEEMCRYYVSFFNLDIQVVRPFNVFGPGQPAHFILPRLHAVARGLDTRPLGNLDVWRDFIHVSDLVRILSAVSAQKGYSVWNAGSGVSVHLLALAKALNIPENMYGRSRRNNEILKTQACTRKTSSLGVISKIKLLETL
jgi:nucleoside-diphosphate-sugar epimerase